MIPVLRRDRKGLPACLVVKTPSVSAGSEDSVLGCEAKIPHVSEPKNQSIKQKQYLIFDKYLMINLIFDKAKFDKDIKMFKQKRQETKEHSIELIK